MREMGFNPEPSKIMHIDINSCFATVEQQYNKTLRNRPLVVAAYKSDGGCILAASIEAKKLGIKTGMRVREGKTLCRDLIVLETDPPKYRAVHLKLKEVCRAYTPDVWPKSIDEFVLNLQGCPALKKATMHGIAEQIKRDITQRVGDYITVSIGIAPNRFLAKTASGLHKPNGLDEINKANFKDIFARLALQDLCGIAGSNAARLGTVGIYSVLDFYNAGISTLRRAFHSIGGYYWYLRLRGWEIDAIESTRKSFGNSYALPQPLSKPDDLAPILAKLTEKMCYRLRSAGYKARGVSVLINYRGGNFWHKNHLLPHALYESRDFFASAYKIMCCSPYRSAVRVLAVSCFALERIDVVQLDLFGVQEKKASLANALDKVNSKWGNFVVGPANLLLCKKAVRDRIAFGGVRELV